MKMRSAVRRAAEAGMAAKRDGVPVLVATVGVAAVAVLEFGQREQPRLEADTTKFYRLGPFGRGRRRSGHVSVVVGSLSCPVSSHIGPLLHPRDHRHAILR